MDMDVHLLASATSPDVNKVTVYSHLLGPRLLCTLTCWGYNVTVYRYSYISLLRDEVIVYNDIYSCC
jgi:hypothetical protein